MIANYHTHTHFCNHADGNALDYAKEAIKNNFKVLGISDHAPNPLVKDYHVRMEPDQFNNYIKDIEVAQKATKGLLKVYKGIEVEYFYNMGTYYTDLLKHLDYMIHGQHYISMDKTMNNLISGFGLHTKAEILVYSEYLVDAMDSGYFNILAHPDLYMCGYGDFDETATKVAHIICKKAKETNTILEYNANGYNRGTNKTPQGIKRKYPRNEFWEIAKSYGVKTILSSDCHTPKYLYNDTIKQAEEEYNNLELNTIQFLDL